MATGAEFFAQLEKRFNQLPAEEKLDKIVEYQKKLTALKEQGLSEEEAVAQLESELPLPSPVPPENDEYGRISHPKKAARDRHALRRGPRRGRRGGGAALEDILKPEYLTGYDETSCPVPTVKGAGDEKDEIRNNAGNRKIMGSIMNDSDAIP